MKTNKYILRRPLVVDLDGTLIRTDMLLESINQFLIKHPFMFFKIIIWMFYGKVILKRNLAHYVKLDVATLPYNKEVLEWLRSEKESGRRIVLATASHQIIAIKIASYLNLFEDVLATEGNTNLKSTAKAQALIDRFGEQAFDYVGNDWPDLQVWIKAHTAHVVNPPDKLLVKIKQKINIGHVFKSVKTSPILSFFKAIRIHQWLKNILIFVPILAAHQYTDINRVGLALMAFLIFSLTASSVYLLNDLVDLDDDRHHSRKCHRPFASGALGLVTGWLTWPIFLFSACILSIMLMPLWFTAVVLMYYATTVAYSLFLKKLAVVDVLTLAILYTMRIIAGTLAVGLELSFWLLLFSMFIFLSLALIKRYSELKEARDLGKDSALRGRGYEPNDLELVSSFGASAGLLSVLVLALYIQDGQAASLYASPKFIWLVCPIMLFWISRSWLITHRGDMHDDPIVFALKDKTSWVVCGLTVLIFGLARFL
jgi:4-hydroxybenzoate polyprenyltransferase